MITNINTDFLEASFKDIENKDYQVLHDLNGEIDSLLKKQLLVKYHIAKQQLTKVFNENTNKDLYLSIWVSRDQSNFNNKLLKSNVVFKKDKSLITSIDQGDQIDIRKKLDGVFGVIYGININFIGGVRKYSDEEIHEVPINVESLPLIDELILNKELNKIYQTTVLSHSLPKEDNKPKSKKMKV